MNFEVTENKIFIKSVTNNIDAIVEARDVANKHFFKEISEGKKIIFTDWIFQKENGEISYIIN